MSTIRDIAREAGVSIGTVSHVLNHPDRVTPATRARVLHAIHHMGWQPNVAAQSLRRFPDASVDQGEHPLAEPKETHPSSSAV